MESQRIGVAPVSYADFFSDMPWLNIPKEREAVLVPPQLPRGGLLGGSGAQPKMSKLQALAAARRKKVEDRKSGEEKVQEAGDTLENLSLQESRSNAQPESAAKRRRLGREAESRQAAAYSDSHNPPLPDDETEKLGSVMNVDGPADISIRDAQAEAPGALRARPSAFAQTLLGSNSEHHDRAQVESFQYPYLALSPSCIQDAFSGPSPDDKVLAAQAKGSLSGKVKK